MAPVKGKSEKEGQRKEGCQPQRSAIGAMRRVEGDGGHGEGEV